MILLTTTEAPRYTRKDVQKRYPDYVVIGDPAGWFYPVERTKVVVMSVGFKSLVTAVRNHLVGNDVKIPDSLTEHISTWWCANVESHNCGEPTPAHVADVRTLAERFFRTFKSWVSDGGKKVAQEEAERRAAICAGCPFNIPESGWCSGCFMKGMITSAAKLVSGWRTSQDARLKHCRICGCDNKLKVHVPTSAMHYPELADRWPAHCWVK